MQKERRGEVDGDEPPAARGGHRGRRQEARGRRSWGDLDGGGGASRTEVEKLAGQHRGLLRLQTLLLLDSLKSGWEFGFTEFSDRAFQVFYISGFDRLNLNMKF